MVVLRAYNSSSSGAASSSLPLTQASVGSKSKSKPTSIQGSDADEYSSTSTGWTCYYIWWAIVTAIAYVYDFTPMWAFGGLFGISILATMLKLIWKKSWFLKLRSWCRGICCYCCFCCSSAPSAISSPSSSSSWWWRPRTKVEESTQKQHSPWRKQISLFFEMAMPYFRESTRGRWLFVGMICLTMLDSAVNVIFSYTSKEFYNALEQKDGAAFQKILILYTAILVGGAPVTAMYNFQRQRLAIGWREWMTARTLHLYTRSRVYYHLDNKKEIDNPDQRIAQDVNSFTMFSLSLLVTLLDNTINLISMSIILYSIEPRLFLVIIAYTFIGTMFTTLIAGRLVPLNFERLQYEADFRYSLVRLRDHAESIAFYQGEGVERDMLNQRFSRVVDNQKDIIGIERNLQMFSNLYQYLTWVLPIAVIAPRYFTGAVALGVITQARSAFLQVTSDLSIIVKQFTELSAFSAGIDRLSSFYQAVRQVDNARTNDTPLLQERWNDDKDDVDGKNVTNVNEHSITILESSSSSSVQPSHLRISHLTLLIPDGSRTLLRDLTLQLFDDDAITTTKHCNLLITGSSGVGKSSLLRAMAGLWTRGHGSIERPRDAFFLPQQPYCTLGSLRSQLRYPYQEEEANNENNEASLVPCTTTHVSTNNNNNSSNYIRRLVNPAMITDESLVDVLHQIGLSHLVHDLNVVVDWSRRLSLGEQQRLAFGRVLVHKPRFVLVDEATSALDLTAEAQMYQLLSRDQLPQPSSSTTTTETSTKLPIRYVSVGHRPSLFQYHHVQLDLKSDGDGGYELLPIITTSETSIANTQDLK